MRVLITGGRDLSVSDWSHTVYRVLRCLESHDDIVLVHGDCSGADQIAKVLHHLYPHLFLEEGHPAENFGKWPQCGPKRNAHMVSLGADLCIALPGGRGTADCVRKANIAGIPVVHISDMVPVYL